MELFEFDIKKFTKIDSKGRLRSIVEFICNDCSKKTTQRIDEFHRKGKLCRNCKRRIQSINEFDDKDVDSVCSNILLSRLNKRYNHRGLTCNLNNSEALSLFKAECHYCGVKNSNKHIYKLPHISHIFYYNGIDRIDSSKGYIRGNVLSCCKKCNVAKSDMKYDEFINHIKRIYANILLRK
jgi:5-methylcytosine-specific restriction endonuclease McrA